MIENNVKLKYSLYGIYLSFTGKKKPADFVIISVTVKHG